jgi:hypothetical protein
MKFKLLLIDFADELGQEENNVSKEILWENT